MLSLKKGSRVEGNGWTSDALSRTHPRVITQMAFGAPPIGLEDSDNTMPDEWDFLISAIDRLVEETVKNCVTVAIELGLYFGQEKHVRGASPPPRPACPDSR